MFWWRSALNQTPLGPSKQNGQRRYPLAHIFSEPDSFLSAISVPTPPTLFALDAGVASWVLEPLCLELDARAAASIA